MMVVDIETSNVDPVTGGIFEIGALDINNPENTFFEQCKIDSEDEIVEESLIITGKTEEFLRDESKQSQKELLEKFFAWIEKVEIKNLICQHPQFDMAFLMVKANKYGLKIPYSYRAIDLHSLAVLKYYQKNEELPSNNGFSEMRLKTILDFCGIKDVRMKFVKGAMKQEGDPHDALVDARLEAECFSRLVYGKCLFDEFKEQEIPNYLNQK